MAETATTGSCARAGVYPLPLESSKKCIATFIHAGPAELDALAPEWSALVEEPGLCQPFFQQYWFRAFAKTIHHDRPFPLVVVREGDTLKGVLPLVRRRRFFGKLPAVTLASLSNVHSCRYDFVCAENNRDEIARAAWLSLKNNRHWTVIEATAVPEGSAFEHIMRHAEKDGYRIARWPTLLSPYLELPVGHNDPFVNCPTRYRKDRKRIQKRYEKLQEYGELSFQVFSSFDEEVFQDFLALERGGWKGRSGGAIACSGTLEDFYREMLKGAAAEGQLRMCALSVGAKRVAMEIAFVVDGHCFSPKIAYDEEFSKCSPGQVLSRWAIEDLVARGIRSYDLLGARARHKALWTDKVRPHANCYIFRPSLVGKFYHFVTTTIAPKIKKARYARYGDPQTWGEDKD